MSVTCNRSVVFYVPPVSSTNKTDCHDITEILLKVALNTIKQTNIDSEAYLISCFYYLWYSDSNNHVILQNNSFWLYCCYEGQLPITTCVVFVLYLSLDTITCCISFKYGITINLVHKTVKILMIDVYWKWLNKYKNNAQWQLY